MRGLWILLVLALLLGIWLVLGTGPTGREGSTAGSPQPERSAPNQPSEIQAADPARPPAAAGGSDPARTLLARDPEPADVEEPRGDPPSASPSLAVEVRVLDPTGLPLAGVPVGVRGEEEVLGRSDGAGRVELRLRQGEPQVRFEVHAESERFAGVRSCLVVRSEADGDHVLVAAPAVAIAGRVIDEAGVGIPGARVRTEIPDRLLVQFPHPLDRTSAAERSAETDAEGAFRLDAVAYLPGAVLDATCEGFEPASAELPANDRSDLFLTLIPLAAPEGDVVRGRVLLPDGTPAIGADVRYAWSETTTDDAGLFTLSLEREAQGDVALGAGLSGYGPAIFESFGAHLASFAPEPPPPVELQLTQPLEIAGRVVGADGEPLANWIVAIRRGVSLLEGMIPPPTAEKLAGYQTSSTDPEGAFRLSGLLEREYGVWAYDQTTLLAVESEQPVPAGTTDLVLVAPDDGLLDEVDGIVRSRAGTPLPSVSVALERATYRTDFGWSTVGGQSVTTDAEGRFRMTGVPLEGVELRVSGTDVVPELFRLDEAQDPTSLDLAVAQRCHFRIEAKEGSLRFHFEDAAGERLSIYRFQSNGWSSSGSLLLDADGRTQVLAVSEDAVAVVLLRDREEIARRPVALAPEGVNELLFDLP